MSELSFSPPPETYLKKKYSIGLRRWYQILRRQGGVCPVCSREFSSARKPVVDHDHKTGKVRGLLCRNCNHRVVGRHRDWRLLKRASDYLKRYGSQ